MYKGEYVKGVYRKCNRRRHFTYCVSQRSVTQLHTHLHANAEKPLNEVVILQYALLLQLWSEELR